MRLECTELREFMDLVGEDRALQALDLVGEDRALQALSSFSVKRNPDVENFIRTNAVAYEKSDNARTSIFSDISPWLFLWLIFLPESQKQ